MAGSSDHQCRRRAGMDDDEMEEGEYVPGQGYQSASDTEEYYNHYSSGESDDEATSKTRWFFVAKSTGEVSCSSSVAANNNNGGYATSTSSAAPPALLACRVCGKEFTSTKAVCGHMKVHALERQQEQGNGKEKEAKKVMRIVGVEKGWGVRGKRSCSGSGRSRSASPSSEPDNPMPTVPEEPKLVVDPMALAYAATNLSPSVPVASAETEISRDDEGTSVQQIHNDAMAIVVEGADPPPPISEPVVLHQAAPPPPQPPLPAEIQAPPVHRQRAALPAAGAQNPVGYTCAECGMWYRTNQALGGHVAGHKNRRLAAAAAAAGTHQQDGAATCRGGSSKVEEKRHHPCTKCPAVFDTGVQLGGHMRKHWKGDPIVPKKKPRLVTKPFPPPPPELGPADDHVAQLRLRLPFEVDVQSPAPAVERVQLAPAPAEGTVEAAPVQPAPEPPVTGRLRLFGIDIGPGVKSGRTREGSPATKDSSADIGGQQ